MIGGSGAYTSSPRKLGAVWCIFLSDYVLEYSLKIDIILYKKIVII